MKINFVLKVFLISLLGFYYACSTAPKKITISEVLNKTGKQYRGFPEFHPKTKNPAFTDNHPKICFDEGHNNLAVDQGFYSPVLELLESDGYQIIHIKEKFTHEILKGCNTIYISAVRGHSDYSNKELSNKSAFTHLEIQNIKKWVKSGGSLLLMTDHKPMSNAAGDLLLQFGIVGSLNNVRNEDFKVPPFSDPGIFYISDNLMNQESPIVKGRNEDERLKKIFFFYGQALKGPKDADVFLRFGANSKIGGLYDEPVIPINDYPAAAIAIKFGKGRVASFGDATVFTSKLDLWQNEKTGINRDGSDNVQMALNVFHWLSGIL
ncbi:MAG: hypothetical protein ACOYL6_15835 [Bacteriovoracaceae bacterium]